MDVLGVNMKSKKQSSKRSKKGIKVVYISSPMKVETSASKFRALVQELTGKDSDAARFMDSNNNNSAENYSSETIDRSRSASDEHGSVVFPMNSYSELSSSPGSDSNIFESFDRFLQPMEGSFMSMFQPNFPHDSFQLDVFN